MSKKAIYCRCLNTYTINNCNCNKQPYYWYQGIGYIGGSAYVDNVGDTGGGDNGGGDNGGGDNGGGTTPTTYTPFTLQRYNIDYKGNISPFTDSSGFFSSTFSNINMVLQRGYHRLLKSDNIYEETYYIPEGETIEQGAVIYKLVNDEYVPASITVGNTNVGFYGYINGAYVVVSQNGVINTYKETTFPYVRPIEIENVTTSTGTQYTQEELVQLPINQISDILYNSQTNISYAFFEIRMFDMINENGVGVGSNEYILPISAIGNGDIVGDGSEQDFIDALEQKTYTASDDYKWIWKSPNNKFYIVENTVDVVATISSITEITPPNP